MIQTKCFFCMWWNKNLTSVDTCRHPMYVWHNSVRIKISQRMIQTRCSFCMFTHICVHLCYTMFTPMFTPMLNHVHTYVYTYVTPYSHLCLHQVHIYVYTMFTPMFAPCSHLCLKNLASEDTTLPNLGWVVLIIQK